MPSSPPVGVGIDVSKGKLDVVLRFAREEDEHLLVPNTPAGIGKIKKALKAATCPIVMESTGRFHLLAALLLSEAKFDVRVINPLIARRYLTAAVRKKKMDKADAAALAQVAVIEKDIPRFTASRRDIHIRQKIGLACALERHLQSLRATCERYVEFQGVMDLATSDAERELLGVVALLEDQKEAVEKEIQALVSQDILTAEWRQLAGTVPGISPYLSCLLSQMLRKDCASPKQWIHFVGYDVTVYESGTWKGRGKLSKRGSPYLRKRLFSAAWGAKQHSPQFRAYYEQLRAEGRSYRESMVIIARKLLRILFAVQKSGMPFSEEHCRFPAATTSESLAPVAVVLP